MNRYLVVSLYVMGAIHVGIACLNLGLARIMKWEKPLDALPLLIREVFFVHAWFISLILTIFAVLTFRFGEPMAMGAGEVYRWIAASIGLFWFTRVIIQIFYYSRSHWIGNPVRTLIHIACLLVYGAMAGTYLAAAFGSIL